MSQQTKPVTQGLIRFGRTRQPEPYAWALIVANDETGATSSIAMSSDEALSVSRMIESMVLRPILDHAIDQGKSK